MWILGPEEAINKFLNDPDLRRAIESQEHRTTDDRETFWGSPAFQELNAACGGKLTDKTVKSIIISVGGDGVQLLNWGTRTATVIAVKCDDLPPHLAHTGLAVAPLIVIEGPHEPSNLNPVLKETVDFLLKHSPVPSAAGDGVLLLLLLPVADTFQVV